MKTELLIDGMLSGTGIRDAVNGGYLEPDELSLSDALCKALATWQANYENAHFEGFPPETVEALDREGIELSRKVGGVLTNVTVGYYSNGLLKRLF